MDTPDVEEPITYQLMTDDTIALLEQVVGEPADLVGHSDGAFVAMQVGMQRPDLVKRLVLSAAASTRTARRCPTWSGTRTDHQFLGPAYGEVSPDGEDHFPVVAAKIGELAAAETTSTR